MLEQKTKKIETSAVDEATRLNALYDLKILDTSNEERFDRVVRLAAHIAGTPIALVSLIDDDRQWFKARFGLDVCETSRSVAFCDHSIQQDTPLIVPNALNDVRFAQNPLVIGEPNIRFYAGFPLILSTGEALGTLCVIDTQPRILSEDQTSSLADLATVVVDELEMRRIALTQAREVQDVAQSAQLIRETRNFYRSILDSCNEAIATYEPVYGDDGAIVDFILTDANDASCTARGMTKAQMVGQRLQTLVPELDQETFDRYVHVVETGDPIQFDDHYVDGHYDDWFRVSAARHSDGGLVIVLSVITEEKKSQLQLKRSRDALDSFTAAVSHDLRTPLGHIAGFVELVRENLENQLDEQNKEFMGYVVDGVDQMRRLIDAMQKHARLGQISIDRNTVDLASLLGDVVRRSQAEIDDLGASIEVDVPFTIAADRLLLDQLFTNLLNNALKYRSPKRPLDVRIAARKSSKGLEINFQDNGIGIPDEANEKVFNLFERLQSSDHEDTSLGIGLAMCREIVRAHGGTIDVGPTLGPGTCFVISLPQGNALLDKQP